MMTKNGEIDNEMKQAHHRIRSCRRKRIVKNSSSSSIFQLLFLSLFLLLLSQPQQKNRSSLLSFFPVVNGQTSPYTTTFTKCNADVIIEADTNIQNGSIDIDEYQSLLFELAPPSCSILDAYNNNVLLDNVWNVLTCICKQFENNYFGNNNDNNNNGTSASSSCCDPTSPQLIVPGYFAEPIYSVKVCQILDRAILAECNRLDREKIQQLKQQKQEEEQQQIKEETTTEENSSSESINLQQQSEENNNLSEGQQVETQNNGEDPISGVEVIISNGNNGEQQQQQQYSDEIEVEDTTTTEPENLNDNNIASAASKSNVLEENDLYANPWSNLKTIISLIGLLLMLIMMCIYCIYSNTTNNNSSTKGNDENEKKLESSAFLVVDEGGRVRDRSLEFADNERRLDIGGGDNEISTNNDNCDPITGGVTTPRDYNNHQISDNNNMYYDDEYVAIPYQSNSKVNMIHTSSIVSSNVDDVVSDFMGDQQNSRQYSTNNDNVPGNNYNDGSEGIVNDGSYGAEDELFEDSPENNHGKKEIKTFRC